MLKIFLTFIFTLTFFLHGYAQYQSKWDILNEGIEAHAIDFIDDNNGWLLTYDKLLKTEDGGESWEAHTLPMELRHSTILKFTSSAIGWATGGDDYPYNNLYKTENSGLSWAKSFGSTNYSVDFTAVNDSVVFTAVYFVGDANDCEGQIFKTINGGKGWIDITPYDMVNDIDLSSFNFFNSEKGLVVGGCSNDNRKILKTFDGGLNWEIQTLPLPFSFINIAHMVNDSTLYFIAYNAKEKPYLYHLGYTRDMFDSWILMYESENPLYNFYALDQDNIFASIEDSLGNLYLMKSTDGGDTWHKKQQIWSEDQIYFNTPLSGFILGNGYYRSTDAGESWIIINFDGSCQDVFFIDDKLGFIGTQDNYPFPGVNSGGVIYKTTDGGKTWTQITNDPATSVLFVNDLIGYTVNYYGQIRKTINQGQKWTEVYKNNPDSTGYEMHPVDIGFMNEDSGWAVGWSRSGPGILGSTDGGDSWDLKWTDPSSGNSLESIHIINKTVWIVGGSGLIIKSVNVDSFVVINTDTDLPLNDVFFIDESRGWIAGGYHNHLGFQSNLLKTIDGGQTWTEKKLYEYLVNDMYFVDSLHGWAVGEDTTDSGMILETFDGGDNWNPVVENLSVPLSAIHFNNDVGWTVGGNGLILKTEDGSTWINQNTSQIYPSNYQLFQNYPNPFNPSTTINFTLPKSEFAELKVYDILGREITTLVSKKLNQGNHTYAFDGYNLASGIYYYQLLAGDPQTGSGRHYREVKKMILLK